MRMDQFSVFLIVIGGLTATAILASLPIERLPLSTPLTILYDRRQSSAGRK